MLGLLAAAVLLVYAGSRLALASTPESLFDLLNPQHDQPSDNDDNDLATKNHLVFTLIVGVVVAALLTLYLLASTADIPIRISWSWLVSRLVSLGSFLTGPLGRVSIAVVAGIFIGGPLRKPLRLNMWWTSAVMAVVAVIVATWLLQPNWLTVDLAAMVLVLNGFISLQPRISFLRMWLIGLMLAGLYDAVQVFLSHRMMEAARSSAGSLMPQAAASDPHAATGGMPMPFMLASPESWHLSAHAAGMLGLGDMLLPGLLVVMAGRISQRTGNRKVFRAAVWGYALGLATTIVVGVVFQAGQPATIYLVPAVGITTMVSVRRHGLWPELKRRAYKRTPPPADEPEPETTPAAA
jgi:presenilin-like A22 family membrane protease